MTGSQSSWFEALGFALTGSAGATKANAGNRSAFIPCLALALGGSTARSLQLTLPESCEASCDLRRDCKAGIGSGPRLSLFTATPVQTRDIHRFSLYICAYMRPGCVTTTAILFNGPTGRLNWSAHLEGLKQAQIGRISHQFHIFKKNKSE